MSLASFSVEKKYVVLPVGRYVDSRKIQFSFGGNVFLEIDTRLDYVNPVNCVYADVSEFIGLQIDVEIHPGVEFVNMQTDEKDRRRYECVNRPEIHFTPSYGWLNDPNGLVKYRSPVTGETVWHMFYQFNPYDTVWGNMHWGHAVSHDLIHWEEKDIALCPDSTGTMFSGSAIVDSDNVSGLKKGKDDPILLFYTAAGGENLMSKGKVFTQCLAFSTDGGKTFSKYEKNPIISAVTPANRDPKVIYCEEMERWIMALYLDRSTYCIFTSEDLINWVKLQDINLEGDAECPDIFPLNVSGNPDDRKWVFRGASHRYLVLECRNYHFDVIQDSKPLNFGSYSYASQTFSGSGDRRISMSWERNITFPNDTIGGQMSYPSELVLRRENGEYFLCSNPVKELDRFFSVVYEENRISLRGGEEHIVRLDSGVYDISFELSGKYSNRFSVLLFGKKLYIDTDTNTIRLGNEICPASVLGGRRLIRMIVDSCSMTVTTGGGEAMITAPWLCDYNLKKLIIQAESSSYIEKVTVKKYNNSYGGK